MIDYSNHPALDPLHWDMDFQTALHRRRNSEIVKFDIIVICQEWLVRRYKQESPADACDADSGVSHE